MKVILLKDVPQVGRRHEVKTVSDGYASNFLFPRKLAEVATEGSLKRLKVLKEQAEGERTLQFSLLKKNLEALSGKKLEMEARSNEQGHLFEGIHAKEIIAALKERLHIDLDPTYLKLKSPLKKTGDHTIEIEALGQRGELHVSISSK